MTTEEDKLDMASGGGVNTPGKGVQSCGRGRCNQKQIDDLHKALEMQLQIMNLHTQAIREGQNQPLRQATLAAPSLQVKNVKVPEGRYEMNRAEFRSYEKDCRDFKKLTGYTDEQTVIQLRLNMDTQLKRAIDTNFPTEWDRFTHDEAIKAVGSIVQHTSNPAVARKDFDNMTQGTTETIREYATRLKSCALDCDFVCPFEVTHNLTEYHVISRIRCGVIDKQLQQDLLQKTDTLATLKDILAYCENFESAKKDSEKLSESFPSISSFETDEELMAAISTYKKAKRSSKKCGACGYDQHTDKSKCPAQGKVCSKCKKPNHFAGVCYTKIKKDVNVTTIISTFEHIISSNSTVTQLPKLRVHIKTGQNDDAKMIEVIADTGAQVILAGTKHLNLLGLCPEQLCSPNCELKHVGGSKLKVLGSHPVQIYHNDQYTETEMYFAVGIENIYLSLQACQTLSIVDKNFPNASICPPVVNNISSVSSDNNPLQPLPTKPTQIPYPATEENVPQLKKWLLEQFSKTTFNTTQALPVMSGAPHHIHLKHDAIPYAAHSPIPIPHHWKQEVKNQLEADEKAGIIQKVPINEPVEWCMRMITVAKKDGRPRRTIDFQPLNKDCDRETHHTPTPFDVVSSIPQHQYKTVVDAFNGYHQVPLDKDSIKLTTFITEFGRYQNLRTPQGLVTSGDAYTRRYDDLINEIERKVKIVDDTLLYDSSIEQSFWHTFDYLKLCGEKGVTLNPAKFQFGQCEVEFVGFKVGWEGFTPSNDMIAAIREFPMPTSPSLADIRSWYGLVNQLAPFIATSPLMSPFRDLLKPSQAIGKKVYWDQELQQIFEKTKIMICELVCKGLSYYDPKKKTILVTDWSKIGIAFVIMQKHCSCIGDAESPFCCSEGWKVSFCNSRYLQPNEANYSPIEGEALAVCWALRKARMYLQGNTNFDIIVDHKPLLKIFGDKSLHAIDNPRLLRLKEQTLSFTFNMKYVKGIKNCADVLSRYPVNHPDTEDSVQSTTITSLVIASATVASSSVCVSLESIHDAVKSDKQYHELRKTIQDNSFAYTLALEQSHLREFYNVKNRLSIVDDLIFYGFESDPLRIVIPKSLRHQIISNLHSANQGSTGMLARARQTVYWPGIDRDITHHMETCADCRKHAPSQQKEPLIMTEAPDYPFQKVVADMFQIDNHFYLVYVDRLTGFAELGHFPTTTVSAAIINTFREFFHRWGIPEEISLDGGPNLVSQEITLWFNSWNVQVRPSSAYYPQSNGRAEAGVKSLKRLLRGNIGSGGSINNDQVAKALLQHRNTPLRGIDKSPAQLALGRHIRDTIPLQRERYKIDPQWAHHLRERERKMTEDNRIIKEQYDLHAKSLKELNKGDEVLCQNKRTKKWDRSGIIVEVGKYRQYLVRTNGSGRISRRNRCDLRPLIKNTLKIQPTKIPSTSPANNKPASNQIETNAQESNTNTNCRNDTVKFMPEAVVTDTLPRDTVQPTPEAIPIPEAVNNTTPRDTVQLMPTAANDISEGNSVESPNLRRSNRNRKPPPRYYDEFQ